MTVPTVDRWSIFDPLLDRLALPADTPVIEWHRWHPGETGEPTTTTVVHPVQPVGTTQVTEHETTPGGTITVTTPAGVQSGDLLIATLAHRITSAFTGWPTAPGWSIAHSSEYTTDPSGVLVLAVLHKRATAGEPASHTFTLPANYNSTGVHSKGMTAWRDVDASFETAETSNPGAGTLPDHSNTRTTSEEHAVASPLLQTPQRAGARVLAIAVCRYNPLSGTGSSYTTTSTGPGSPSLSAPTWHSNPAASLTRRMAVASWQLTADHPGGYNAPSLTHVSTVQHSAVTRTLALPARIETTTDPDPTGPAGWLVDADRTAALAGYSVAYGRASITDLVGPLQATAELAVDLAGPLPTVGERFRLAIADTVADALGLADDDRPRFTGEVTDLVEDDAGRLAVIGVGRRARLDMAPVRGAWPAELDGARVQRVLDLAAEQLPDLSIGTVAPGKATLLRKPAGRVPAGEQLTAAAVAGQGQIVEQRTGTIDYHGRDHRRGATSKLTLSGATELLRPFTRQQGIGAVVNDAVISYGRDGRSVRVTDDDSANLATGLGLHSQSLATELADAGDAYALGTDLVGKFARPRWLLPLVTVELVRSVTSAKLAKLLALRHGQLVTLTDTPLDGQAFVEGITEQATRTSWRMTLTLADKHLAGIGLRYVDIPATKPDGTTALTYQTVTPTLRIIDTATAEATDL